MKKYAIFTIIIICFSLLLACFTCKSFALGLDDMHKIPQLYTSTSMQDQDEAIEIGNLIVSIVRYVGEFIAVVMLIIIGIRYVLASAEEKAEYKQSMWPYILGAVLLFAGATFTDWIYEIFHISA